MRTLHGYTFDESQWKSLGGNGQCVAAEKKGKNYFIKRLNKPKYPESDNFSGEFKRRKIAECDTWLSRRKAIVSALPGAGSGNVIKPIEYFREGPCFYEITNRVVTTNIPYTEIWKESKTDKARMMMTIAKSLSDIHKAGVVHGDLDPGNILISRSAAGHLITKLIDFTDAFFEKDPPEAIMSKDAWLSPEVALYSKAHDKEPNPYREYIGCKADVFSLGLIFHQYCTEGGSFPEHPGDYPWQAFAGGGSLSVNDDIEAEFKEIIGAMIEAEPSSRPSMEEVHRALRKIVSEKAKTDQEGQRRGKTEENPGERISIGCGMTKRGACVVAAKLNERNEKKVELVFSDGRKQIMDLSLALKQDYVEINEADMCGLDE